MDLRVSFRKLRKSTRPCARLRRISRVVNTTNGGMDCIQVLLLEPTNYDAALFIGDVYFKQHVQGSAGEWFARAIQIDPNRETAYRYWADSLLALGRNNEARLKFIDAIVAEPSRQRAWDGAQKWAHLNKTELHLLAT